MRLSYVRGKYYSRHNNGLCRHITHNSRDIICEKLNNFKDIMKAVWIKSYVNYSPMAQGDGLPFSVKVFIYLYHMYHNMSCGPWRIPWRLDMLPCKI